MRPINRSPGGPTPGAGTMPLPSCLAMRLALLLRAGLLWLRLPLPPLLLSLLWCLGGKPGFHLLLLSLVLLRCAWSLPAPCLRPPVQVLPAWLPPLLGDAGAERPSAPPVPAAAPRTCGRRRLATAPCAGCGWLPGSAVRPPGSAAHLLASCFLLACGRRPHPPSLLDVARARDLGGFKTASHMSTGNREPSSLVNRPFQ